MLRSPRFLRPSKVLAASEVAEAFEASKVLAASEAVKARLAKLL